MRWRLVGVVCAAFALAYAAVGYQLVFEARVGATVLTISESQGWGVHSGDLFVAPLAFLSVASFLASMAAFVRARTLVPVPVVPGRRRSAR